jgi:hypothetical protein
VFLRFARHVMDLYKTISDLHQELERLNRAIGFLEELQRSGAPAPESRRGRKSMDGAGRRLVSERMKRYWSGRRPRR